MTNRITGSAGELDVVAKVPCPNCGKSLMTLPPNYPLYDVQCTGCSFRAQVKTNRTKPKAVILGAGWDILDKVLKSGFIVPPLITNFVWSDSEGEHQLIKFYPFVPKSHLAKRILSPTARRANYRMFNYVGLDKLTNFILYQH